MAVFDNTKHSKYWKYPADQGVIRGCIETFRLSTTCSTVDILHFSVFMSDVESLRCFYVPVDVLGDV